MATVTVTEQFDPPTDDGDARRVQELGYEQELKRGMGIFDSVAMGFATISPVVGLYAVVLVGMVVAGGAWLWVLPVALAGQCLLLGVYSELAAKWPLSNGAYQWTRRLIGPRYGWLSGWVALCAYAVANTTIAYLGAPWALVLLGITPTAHAIVITGALLVLFCSLVNAIGVDALKVALRLGVAAEAIVSIGIGLALLLVFREQSPSALFDTFGAEALSGGSTFAALLAALAVAGWAFIGFDSTVAAAEETKGAAKHVPRAVWMALLSVGALVILNAFATTLAHPNPADVTAGKDIDPVSTAVVLELRQLVEQAVRGRRAARVRRLRDGRAGRDRARDLLGRARRRPARLALPAQGGLAGRRRSAASWPRPSSPGSACCSGWRRPRSAA